MLVRLHQTRCIRADSSRSYAEQRRQSRSQLLFIRRHVTGGWSTLTPPEDAPNPSNTDAHPSLFVSSASFITLAAAVLEKSCHCPHVPGPAKEERVELKALCDSDTATASPPPCWELFLSRPFFPLPNTVRPFSSARSAAAERRSGNTSSHSTTHNKGTRRLFGWNRSGAGVELTVTATVGLTDTQQMLKASLFSIGIIYLTWCVMRSNVSQINSQHFLFHIYHNISF